MKTNKKKQNGIMQPDNSKEVKFKYNLSPLPIFVNGEQYKIINPLSVGHYYEIIKVKDEEKKK